MRIKLLQSRYALKTALAATTLLVMTNCYAQQSGWFRGGSGIADHIEASPLIADLTGDGQSEIIVPSTNDKLYIYNHDGTTFTLGAAWPKTLGLGDGTMASVAVGDIDGLSGPEIVVAGDDDLQQNGRIVVYKPDGSTLGTRNFETSASAKSTPCLVDCYRYDGAVRHQGLEIVYRDGVGKVHVLVWKNNSFTDQYTSAFRTITLDADADQYGLHPIDPSVCAAYEGGNITYIVAGSTNNSIYRWRVTSTDSNNWQVQSLSALTTAGSADTRFYSSPALVNLDLDSGLEIIAAANLERKVYVWDDDGSTMPTYWPQTLSGPVSSSPAVADLDGNGIPEVVIGCDDGRVYAFKADGSTVSGWPVTTNGDVFGSPVIGEIDGTAGLEVFVGSIDRRIYAWSATGAAVTGWPKRLNSAVYGAVALGDVHNGGRMAVVTGAYDGRLFLYDLARKSLDVNMGWKQFRGGQMRQGHP